MTKGKVLKEPAPTKQKKQPSASSEPVQVSSVSVLMSSARLARRLASVMRRGGLIKEADDLLAWHREAFIEAMRGDGQAAAEKMRQASEQDGIVGFLVKGAIANCKKEGDKEA